MWRKSLLIRLVSTSLLLSIMIVSLMGVLAGWQAKEALKQMIFERLNAMSQLKAGELERWVEDQKQDALCLSKSSEIHIHGKLLLTRQPADPAYWTAYKNLSAFFEHVSAIRTDFQEVLLLSAIGGKIVFSTDKAHEGEYRVQDTFYIQGRQATFVQSIFPWPVTLKPTMTVSTPLLDDRGDLLGVLAVHLNLKRMDEIVFANPDLGRTSQSYLVDSLNVFVSAERFGHHQYPRGVHSYGIDKALQRQNGQDLYLNYAGIPVVGVYRWLPNWQLALITEINQDEAFAQARFLVLTIFLIGVAASGLLAVTVYYLTKRIIQPILSVTEASQRVAQGELDQRVPVLTQDEVGQLANAFNMMTGQLQTVLQQLRHSEEHFRLLIENVSDLISIVNRDGVIKYASPALTNTLGYTTTQLMAMNLCELVHDDNKLAERAFSTILEQADTFVSFEVHLCSYDGHCRDFEVIGKNCLANESVQGIVLVARDITLRKQAENQIRELNASLEQRVRERTAALEAVNNELESYSYSVSHDLRAPLRGIDGYSQLLLQEYSDKLTGDGLFYLKNIRIATQRMGQLINDLLQLSRIGRQEMQRRTVDLTTVASEVLAHLRQQEPDRQVECLVQPNWLVEGDQSLLRLVLENLLSNAWKYTRKTQQARIELGVKQQEQGLVHYIRDNGIGFDMKYVGKLFVAFQRLHHSEDFEGTGIGLATVQRIIHRHGGKIWAEGEVGKGAIFYFTLQ